MSYAAYVRNCQIISIKFVICDAKNVICPQSYKPIHIQIVICAIKKCHMRHMRETVKLFPSNLSYAIQKCHMPSKL